MSFLELLKLIFPLLIISLMLYGLLYFVKKYSFKRGGKSLLNVKVLNNQMIMPKKFLSVVKVKDKLLILGISETNITLLKEIDADESDLTNETEPIQNKGFADLLKKYLNK
jgi:flagellar protein FliO/FliZ